jgi:hypothetical protein
VATLEQYILRVRRKVADANTVELYSDPYYEDALRFALSKLNSDFQTSYVGVENVPADKEFLLEKLATIEMCYVRAVEDEARRDDAEEDDSLGDIASVAAPDISITKTSTSDKQSSDVWLSLAAKLQSEYDGELVQDTEREGGGEVRVLVANRRSIKTGGLANRAIDPGLPAVSLAAVVAGRSVALSWGILYSDLFLCYEVCRAADAAFANEECVASIYDNQVHEYTDVVETPGAYYYRVKTVNPNGIRTEGASIIVGVV